MTGDPQSIQLQVDPDERFAAGVGGAARYFADAAGLKEDAVSLLQHSIVAACREAIQHLKGNHPHLEVTLTRFGDRIEVALAHAGETAPAIGLDIIAGFSARPGSHSPSTGVLKGVDRVQYESVGGMAVTRLTKYLGRA